MVFAACGDRGLFLLNGQGNGVGSLDTPGVAYGD